TITGTGAEQILEEGSETLTQASVKRLRVFCTDIELR
ncbi:hypothetical protein EVA_19573, partial [gut metagenome]